jgi:stage IV sporulation protein FB
MKRLFSSSGYIRLGRFRGAPIRAHWSTPIGLLLFSGLSLNPLVWAALLSLMLVHELGHALMARRYDLQLVSIDITAIGGRCELEGDPTLRQAAIVAWGGVLAQAVVLVAAFALRTFVHVISAGLLDGVWDTLITTNAILIVINLLPIKPLDGATAWRLFKG